MDPQAQKQAIVAKLTGAPPETLPPPGAFDEPWRAVYQGARPVDSFFEAESLLAKITRPLPGGEALARQLIAVLPSDAFGTYPCLDQIADRFAYVRWLWPSWIPRGMLTLFGAAPGAGQSLVALDLARRVIHGEPWPDGTPPGDTALSGISPRNVLIVDAEGAPALVVVDSLAAPTAHGETCLEAARAILGFWGTIARKGHLGPAGHPPPAQGAGRSSSAAPSLPKICAARPTSAPPPARSWPSA